MFLTNSSWKASMRRYKTEYSLLQLNFSPGKADCEVRISFKLNVQGLDSAFCFFDILERYK